MRRLVPRSLMTLPIVALLAVIIVAGRAARCDDATDLDPEQIKAALHTNTQIEGGFIERTIAMVKAGKLPRDMFTSCFLWARKKPRHQFQYFRQALIIRAAQIGITLS